MDVHVAALPAQLPPDSWWAVSWNASGHDISVGWAEFTTPDGGPLAAASPLAHDNEVASAQAKTAPGLGMGAALACLGVVAWAIDRRR